MNQYNYLPYMRASFYGLTFEFALFKERKKKERRSYIYFFERFCGQDLLAWLFNVQMS